MRKARPGLFGWVLLPSVLFCDETPGLAKYVQEIKNLNLEISLAPSGGEGWGEGAHLATEGEEVPSPCPPMEARGLHPNRFRFSPIPMLHHGVISLRKGHVLNERARET